MYYSENNTELYSETGYPSTPIRSRTEALPIIDIAHSETGYPSTPIRSRTEVLSITDTGLHWETGYPSTPIRSRT